MDENHKRLKQEAGKIGLNHDQTEMESRLEIEETPGPIRPFNPVSESPIDIAAMIRELVYARDHQNALANAVSEFRSSIRKHRDSQASQLHRAHDLELYGMLD
jgi:hypothetical protein